LRSVVTDIFFTVVGLTAIYLSVHDHLKSGWTKAVYEAGYTALIYIWCRESGAYCVPRTLDETAKLNPWLAYQKSSTSCGKSSIL